LYTTSGSDEDHLSDSFLQHIPSNITEADNYHLDIPIEEEKILRALNQFQDEKALGLDGFTLYFYKKCWHIIQKYFTRMLCFAHKAKKLRGATNSSFLALLPKEHGASSLNHFRPISLCNISYKILSKIIANRLNPLLSLLIIPNEEGFFAERQIWDNYILIQEAIHASNIRGESGMAIKLDMANTFDRVEHKFLFKVMRKFGFSQNFMNWINSCIDSP